MTIAELIEKLEAYPPRLRVVCHDGEYEDYFDIKDMYLVKAANVSDAGSSETVLKLTPFDDGVTR